MFRGGQTAAAAEHGAIFRRRFAAEHKTHGRRMGRARGAERGPCAGAGGGVRPRLFRPGVRCFAFSGGSGQSLSKLTRPQACRHADWYFEGTGGEQDAKTASCSPPAILLSSLPGCLKANTAGHGQASSIDGYLATAIPE